MSKRKPEPNQPPPRPLPNGHETAVGIAELEKFGLSVRTINALDRGGYCFIEQLKDVLAEKLHGIDEVGLGGIGELRMALHSYLRDSQVIEFQRLRDEARQFCDREKLDLSVREVCHSGKEIKPGRWLAKWDAKTFECQDDESKSSCVYVPALPAVIYKALNFGETLLVFRRGPWVSRTQHHAEELAAKRWKLERMSASERDAMQMASFEPFFD